ncbi:methyl-accepting chemotaxis protein [Fusibacter sp. 3D3]|uniref:methyl-accepting chemotaxis protein n=1 Tax=Fusibacter sp. 3D3 TaxID=1048380 RepID=UPI0008537DBF|nr:methyl-accepting chemotaxis protein [Fusibacter sp. 3D3]GAU75877.1 methyl-accepting chemotaxis protein [Fusibacter sp. 3D3]
MFKNIKLVHRIIMMAVVIVVINLVLQANLILNMKSKDLLEATIKAEYLSSSQAALFSEQMTHIEFVVKNFSEEFAMLIKKGRLERSDVLELLSESLKENKQIVGHGVGFMANAFDQKDNEFKFQNAMGSDEQGRFLPYITLSDGKNPVVEPLVGYDIPGDGDWYILPMQTGESIVTEPYLYPVNGEEVLMFTISYPIKMDGKPIGVVTADIELNEVQGILEQETQKNLEGMNALMVTGAQNVVGSTIDKDSVNSNLSETLLFQNMKRHTQESSYFEYVQGLEGRQLIIRTPVSFFSEKKEWQLIHFVPESVIYQAFKKNLAFNLMVLAGALLLITFIIFYIQSSIKRPINQLMQVIDQVAKGDLTKQCALNSTDELGQLAHNFDQMILKMRQLIGNVHNSAEVVEESAGKMIKISDQSVLSITDVTTIVSQIAEANLKQSEDIEGIVQKTSILSEMIDRTSQTINEVVRISDQAQGISAEGVLILRELDDKTVTTKSRSKEIATVVEDVNQAVNSIDQITAIIENIASQTNLLALNASIEAARAGEAGRGFAVVADEIRTLAEQTSKATKDIKKVVEEVISKSDDAVISVSLVGSAQEEQFQIIKKSIEIFNEINQAILHMTDRILAVGNSAGTIETSKDEILDAITNISAVSEETTASTEEATSAMIEQKNGIENLNEYGKKLSNLTLELNNAVNQFTV